MVVTKVHIDWNFVGAAGQGQEATTGSGRVTAATSKFQPVRRDKARDPLSFEVVLTAQEHKEYSKLRDAHVRKLQAVSFVKICCGLFTNNNSNAAK